MISALILTYNEETILDRCLSALDFVDDIVVFDSFSTDQTLDIAAKHQATIKQRVFDNYANQRNAALQAVNPKTDWILMVDADEIVTPELKLEILEVVIPTNDITMYRVRRKDMFQNKWIKQSSGYPTWFPRLFKYGTVTVEREINEEYLTTGQEARLQAHLIHYPFNKGMTWWFEKHHRYAAMEAKKMVDEIKDPITFNMFLSKDPVIRRKAQKRLSYHLPFRPYLIFMAFYVLKGGFINGKAGLDFCKLRFKYETMIDVKFKELNKQSS